MAHDDEDYTERVRGFLSLEEKPVCVYTSLSDGWKVVADGGIPASVDAALSFINSVQTGEAQKVKSRDSTPL